MGAEIVFREQANKELSALPNGLKIKLLALLKLAQDMGLSAIPPKRRKHLRNDIWEFRVNASEGTARALYFTRGEQIIVVVVFVKKTERTPIDIIDLAEKRRREA
jgi:phage-related protein